MCPFGECLFLKRMEKSIHLLPCGPHSGSKMSYNCINGTEKLMLFGCGLGCIIGPLKIGACKGSQYSFPLDLLSGFALSFFSGFAFCFFSGFAFCFFSGFALIILSGFELMQILAGLPMKVKDTKSMCYSKRRVRGP